jgi:2-polyprenyl-3-methyl-5-hydroxy-6-metoxy-1,4-benzoquinol methylase
MDASLVQQLNQINQRFYTQFAGAFAGSRSLNQPSLTRLLNYVPAGGRVLDVGCGHGRIAHLLNRERPGARYVGLDFSAEFVRLARQGAADLTEIVAQFEVADLLQPSWNGVLAGQQFDTILILAVMHHIPGFQNRQTILQNLRGHLAPTGRLVLSAWQFTSNQRMRRKIVSWDKVGLERTAELEVGDYLLDWKRGGVGYRYCHLIDQEELTRLAAGSDLKLLESFRADGKEGDLSLFGVMLPQ